MNPKFVDTYIINEGNYKDEILIHHLMQVSLWKARHGNIKAAWKKVMDGILLEKIEGSFFCGYQCEHHPEQIPKCVLLSCTG